MGVKSESTKSLYQSVNQRQRVALLSYARICSFDLWCSRRLHTKISRRSFRAIWLYRCKLIKYRTGHCLLDQQMAVFLYKVVDFCHWWPVIFLDSLRLEVTDKNDFTSQTVYKYYWGTLLPPYMTNVISVWFF